jgi:hypothetical protein
VNVVPIDAMGKLPFMCKDCGATGDAEVAKLMGVNLTCEFCGATVVPPKYDVKLEPVDAMFVPPVSIIITKLLGCSTADAMKIIQDTRVLGTGVPAETADNMREKVGKLATLTFTPRF